MTERPPLPALGKFLLKSGVLSTEQLATALRQQVVFGGRLGTNLLELGYADHDQIASALAKFHGVPAALIRHIRAADPRARALVPGPICLQLCIIPLAFATAGGRRLVVCMRDPGDKRAVQAIERHSRIPVIAAACPERTLHVLLAQFCGGPLPARLSSPPDQTAKPIPSGASGQWAALASRDHADAEQLVAEEASMPELSLVDLDHEAARRDYTQISPQTAPLSLSELADRLRQKRASEVVPADAVDGAPTEPPAVIHDEAPPRRRAASSLSEALLEAASAERIEEVLSEPVPVGPPPLGLEEALATIRKAEERAAVSAAVIAFLKSHFDAALVLVVRGDVAYGYRGFGGHFDDESVESILVPLTVTSPFQVAHRDARRYIGAGGGDERSLFGRFLRLFPLSNRPELCLVDPVAIRERIVCLVYAHVGAERELSDAALDDVAVLTVAMGEAFHRLIRAHRPH